MLSSWPSVAAPRLCLTEAAAAGTTKMRVKMAEAVALAKLGDPVKVDWALGHAAVNSRFAEADLGSILSYHARTSTGPRHQASETRSLTQGTGAWSALLGTDDQLAPVQLDPVDDVVADDIGRGRAMTSTVSTGVAAAKASAAGRARSATVPSVGVPSAPPLPADLEALLRGLRLPHIRRHAPEVLATAKVQRWDPAEVLKALLVEEAAGRARSALATRRAAAAFPTGKTFEAWQPQASSVPAPTQQALRSLEWIGRRENLVVCGPSGTGKTVGPPSDVGLAHEYDEAQLH
jgi:hypothetical protein